MYVLILKFFWGILQTTMFCRKKNLKDQNLKWFKNTFPYKCCILTFDPAKHAIPKTAEVHIPLACASLADKMEQSKIPWYSHRLMDGKRVTCELHDSYFRSITIKRAIPKTAKETHFWWPVMGRYWVGD